MFPTVIARLATSCTGYDYIHRHAKTRADAHARGGTPGLRAGSDDRPVARDENRAIAAHLARRKVGRVRSHPHELGRECVRARAVAGGRGREPARAAHRRQRVELQRAVVARWEMDRVPVDATRPAAGWEARR